MEVEVPHLILIWQQSYFKIIQNSNNYLKLSKLLLKSKLNNLIKEKRMKFKRIPIFEG